MNVKGCLNYKKYTYTPALDLSFTLWMISAITLSKNVAGFLISGFADLKSFTSALK